MMIAKKRILFFAYDGTGMGHLMRLIKIASAFRDDYVPIVVTGHKAVVDIVMPGIEFCRIPSFESFERATEYAPDILDTIQVRKKLLKRIVQTLKPVAIATDHKPFGKKNELLEVISEYNCLKFLIMRGIVGNPQKIRKTLFPTENIELIDQYYKRILIASIPSIDDFSKSDFFPDILKKKCQHVGFVTKHIDEEEILRIRTQRGLTLQDKWIVCSAGGGRLGETIIEKCVELSSNPRFADCRFDVIWGGYSDLKWPNELYDTLQINERVTFSRKTSALPKMHAAADIVICSGGYNSLMECMQGHAKHVLAYSVQTDLEEQSTNITKLGRFYPIHKIKQMDDLEEMLAQCLSTPATPSTLPNMDGAEQIKRIIENDVITQTQ